jgi:hypothetical protein
MSRRQGGVGLDEGESLLEDREVDEEGGEEGVKLRSFLRDFHQCGGKDIKAALPGKDVERKVVQLAGESHTSEMEKS